MQKKLSSKSGFFRPRVLVALFLCGTVCSVIEGTLLAFFRAEVPTKFSQRTLTFAERVAYQRAIEEIYWRHRIWPKERPDPKPSLDAVMPQAQLERKVKDYLRKSQALEDHWQRPITAEQLQAEIDRMAQHTKQPDVLRELFEALGNNPFVIAECLARPGLAERLATGLDAYRVRFEGELRQPLLSKVEAQVPVTIVQGSANYTLPAIASPSGTCTVPWTPTSLTNAPDPRDHHTAVWTGSEMIVWGGAILENSFNTGRRYNPSTDSWTATSTTNAPTGRGWHTAVWTGSEMIVWGGGDAGNGYLNSGGRYNPSTDSWTATSTTNAPVGRELHTAVWTGGEMIVWGGEGMGSYLNTGGRYNPSTDSWTATSTTGAPAARASHTAVWTGSGMIIWGGGSISGVFNTGGRYNPSTDSWIPTNPANAPNGRDGHTAVWTGDEMIVWGGNNPSIGYFSTGGRYDPSTDSWVATSTTSAPSGRWLHTVVWTGSEMIAWGGFNSSNGYLNTGGRYNPSTDTWVATDAIDAPAGREYHTAVWIGSEMIVWGGETPNDTNTGSRYCPAAPTPTPTPTATASPTPTPTPTSTPTPPQTVVLYDQYNNAGTFATVSATFSDAPPYNCDLADDFVVPAGQTWNVQSIDADGVYFNGSGPANSFNVFFYSNNGGFPGTQIYGATNQPWTQNGTTFTVNLPTAAVLTAGTYWVEIQANMTLSTGGEWGWTERTVTANNAAHWQNPAGGFGPPPSCPASGCPMPCPTCISWGIRQCCTGSPAGEPDQVFRLSGTIVGPTPTPTPTSTESPTPTAAPTPCTGRCGPTPRPNPTSPGRPTPPSRLTPPPTPTGSPRPTPAPRP